MSRTPGSGMKRGYKQTAEHKANRLKSRYTGPVGHKQTPEHIAKRMRFGAEHQNWKADAIQTHTGRQRARKLFPIQPCEVCGGGSRVDRHHIDGNTKNNEPSNIAFLCRRHHMQADGRLAALIERNREA